MKNQTAETGKRGEVNPTGTTYRYAGLVLYARAGDGTYWVSGEERWMSIAQIDAMLDDREQCEQ